MNSKSDPLSALVSADAKSTDRLKLAELLKPFLIIDQESKAVVFLPAFDHLRNNADRLEIVLAGVKAKALLFNEPDGMSQGDVVNLAIMPEGSAKSTLKRLADNNKIRKDKVGRYSIPGHRVSELIDKFSKQ